MDKNKHISNAESGSDEIRTEGQESIEIGKSSITRRTFLGTNAALVGYAVLSSKGTDDTAASANTDMAPYLYW